MTILLAPRATKDAPYFQLLLTHLAERGHIFIATPSSPFALFWHRLRGARVFCAASLPAKIALTIPARALGMKVFWFEPRLVDRMLVRMALLSLYRFTARFATIIVASRAIRQQLTDRGVNGELIHIISPGIALEAHGVQRTLFTSIAEKKTKRRAGFALGTISALEEEKGIEYLLQAFRMAHESIPELHLTIIGHGSEKTALQWLAKKLGIMEHVLFVGWQEDTERWLADFDLIIAPQIRKEGFGEYLLAAMAYGRPIIATDTGSFPEIVERRKTGIIIEAGNASMLAEAIINLYHHPDWREEMGRRARERVEEYFSLQRMVNAWDVLLRHER